MTLPAELADLEASYASLLAQVDARTLDPGQALEAAGHLGVFDADGKHWTVSLETEPPNTVFLCATPGDAPVPTSPDQYTPTPGFGPAPAAPASAADWMTTPPTDPVADHDPFTQVNPAAPSWDTAPEVAPPAAPGAAPAPKGVKGPGGGFNPAALLASILPKRSSTSSGDPSPLSGLLAGRGRTIAVVAVALVVVIVAKSCLGGGGDETGAGPAAELACPALTAEVAGISGTDAELLGCLDGTDEPGSKDRGPQIAYIAVTANEAGEISFDPTRGLSRADALASAGGLYRFAGGRPPADSTPVNLEGIAADRHADVQLAADLRLIDPANLKAAEPATKGMMAVVVARALAAAEGVKVEGASPATDAAGQAAGIVEAHGFLAARGIVPADAAAFGFDTPLTALDWVRIAGNAAHHVMNPQAAKAAATAPGSEGPAELDGDAINSTVSALISGQAELAAGVIDGADATSNATRLRAAAFAGLDAAGLRLSSGPANVTGDTATSDFTVTDPEDGATVGGAKGQWKRTGDGWKLVDWPEIAPAS